jgi:phi LC3 family holin
MEGELMMNSKWRNGGLWVALASALLMAVQAIAALFGYVITNEQIADVMVAVNAVLFFLAVAGVISNPKSGTGFKDEK